MSGPNPSGLCMCGCGGTTAIAQKTHTASGWVRGEHKRYIQHHHLHKGTLEERFWENVDKGEPDDCWLWTASTDSRGYGRLSIDGRFVAAHRIAYELLVGPIPEGLYIDHLCRTPLCVNPTHMETVSNGENVLRGEGPTARNARKTHCHRGHPLSGENLKVRRDGSRLCAACHRERAAQARARSRHIDSVWD